jgi:DNA-binding beta-propeller fold protein YncE
MCKPRFPAGAVLAVLCWTGAAPAIHAQAPPPLLAVVNQKDHSLSIADPQTNTVVATVDLKEITGHEVAVSPDGRTAFVPIYGDSGVGRPGTNGKSILAIDLKTHAIKGRLAFTHGVRPHCILFNPHDGLLYVTTELDQDITLVDPARMKIVGTIPTTQAQSHMLAISHDGRFGYTANVGPGTVSVLDLRARKALKVIPISANTQRIAISNDDRWVFTADQTAPRLVVIDTAHRSVARSVKLPAIAYGTAPTRDGKWLLVTMRPLHQVAVIDLTTLQIARTIDVPETPTEVVMRPDNKFAYVSCGHDVAVIDLKRWTVSSTIHAGDGADGLAWAQ